MQLHDVRTACLSNKKKVRIGRGPGSGVGKTAGRGIKGAASRSGFTIQGSYEGGQMPLFRRLPKRGFRNGPFRKTHVPVNVGDLNELFTANSNVGPEELKVTRLAKGCKDALIKILGDGDLNVALNITAHAFSKTAIEKIEKAGGTVNWINGAPKKPAPNFKQIDAKAKRAANAAAVAAKAAAKA